MALINAFGEIALDETVQKLVVTQFIGNKSMNYSQDETNEYFVFTGTTNAPGITTYTITMNKMTGETTWEWS